jgi:hypothetical protein
MKPSQFQSADCMLSVFRRRTNFGKIVDPIGSTRLPAAPCRSKGMSMPCPPSTHPQSLIAVAASISRIVAMRSIRRDLVGYRQDAVAIVVAQLAQPFGEVRDSFWIRFLFQGNAAHDFAKRETHSDDAVASRGSAPSVGLFAHAMVRNPLQVCRYGHSRLQFY